MAHVEQEGWDYSITIDLLTLGVVDSVLFDLAGDGDVILLAGKGHEDYQVVGHEKRHMDEREIVAEYLKKREAERSL